MIIKRTFTTYIILSACMLLSAAASARSATVYGSRKEALGFIRTADSVLAPVYGPLAEQIVSRFELENKEGTGIDVGGGPGNLILELCRRSPRMRWIDADINPHFFPHLYEKAREAGFRERVGAVIADAQALPFCSGYADLVVSRGSFQFWEDKRLAFSEIYRVLKPGGAAFIGRGFSENLPVETARRVREGQGDGPKYDLARTAELFREIMQDLNLETYQVIFPRPPGAEGLNYGIWLEFRKPL